MSDQSDHPDEPGKPLMDFQVIVVVKVAGKLFGRADDVGIETDPAIEVRPMLMFMPPDALSGKGLDDEEQAHLIRVIAHHAIKRAEMGLRPQQTALHDPVPVSDAPPDKRN